jgi:trans-aconitate methyltransferase
LLVSLISAYCGTTVCTLQLATELAQLVGKQKARVVDLCCGVGFSTRALQAALPDAETVVGVDASPQMVRFKD